MNGKIWIRLGLSLATLFCLFSLVPAAYLEILNLIDKESSRDHTILHAVWAASCVMGPLLAWIGHFKQRKIWPWFFVSIPSIISAYEILTHFVF